jgi:hypothetical protein
MIDPLAPLHALHKHAVIVATHLIAQLGEQEQQQINLATQHGATLSLEVCNLPDVTRVQLWLVEIEGQRTPVAKITTTPATIQ